MVMVVCLALAVDNRALSSTQIPRRKDGDLQVVHVRLLLQIHIIVVYTLVNRHADPVTLEHKPKGVSCLVDSCLDHFKE